MKKQKLPGDNISLKTKKNEVPAILDWINMQSNLMDSLRYLIENEIKDNGLRNLQQHIPADRGFAYDESASAGVTNDHSDNQIEPAHESTDHDKNVVEVEDDIDDEDIESWM